MSNVAKTANEPELRFAGFTDPWEQRKLGEVAEKITTKNLAGAVREVFTNSAEYGVISQSDFFDHEVAKQSSIVGYYVVEPGDFVYNPRISTTAPVGPIRRNTLGRRGVMSPLYTVFRLTADVDGTYLSHYFKTDGWHPFMRLEGNSGARSDRFSIGDSAFFEMPIPLPSETEQAEIGRFLDFLDSLITLHQRKYDKLCTVKKSMLEKMFPKDGATEPELRFAGFADPWEQRKLGGLYARASEKNDGSFGVDSVISVANMRYNPAVNITDESYLRTYNIMRLGDIAFEGNRSGNYAHGRFVENDIGDGVVSHVFEVLRPKERRDLSFWKYYIHDEGVMGDILMRSTKATTMMHNVVVNDFLQESLPVPPSIEEESEIGRFFSRLDSLITLHQRKLDLLKSVKRSLLDKMFV